MSAWQQITNALAHEFADFDTVGDAARIVFRLCFAAALGAVLGYERERAGKSAGLRTHVLVSLGAALIVLVPGVSQNSDAALSRVIQGLVAGIGFLGAGTIVKGHPGDVVLGLTTAASIWTTAALGILAGTGSASTALVGAALALFVLQALPGGGPPHLHEGQPHNSPPTRELHDR